MRGFSRLVHQIKPRGIGGRSSIGMSTTSSRSKIGTVELVGCTIRPRATDALVGLYQDYRRSGTDGYAAQVTDTVERLTGRPARSLDDLLAEIAPDLKATDGS
jgi:hypothetical protein